MNPVKLINSCENCVVGWKNFANLSTSEIRLVNENRYEAVFKPGEILIKQGSPISHAVFLSRGMAKSFIEGADGKNYILEILRPSSLIIGSGVYVDLRNSVSVAALTEVHTCFISLQIINQLVQTNPGFAAGMIQDLGIKAFQNHQRLASFIQKKMPGRLAEALLFFADELYKTKTFELILSKQELGEMTNMAKESVVRILKELNSSGVVESVGTVIRILDIDKLRMISEKG